MHNPYENDQTPDDDTRFPCPLCGEICDPDDATNVLVDGQWVCETCGKGRDVNLPR